MTTSQGYGCYNRDSFKGTVTMVKAGQTVTWPFRMDPDCQYQKTELGKVDARCVGCVWNENEGAWIPYDMMGKGRCPHELWDKFVDVKLRSGRIALNTRARAWRWWFVECQDGPTPEDIVAYRVVS